MAANVQEHGRDDARALLAAAQELNARHFGGALTALLVEITAPASPRAYATHQPRTPEGVDCVIRIAPSVMAEGELFWKDVLLHEMIHVWQAETGKSEPGYQGHGPNFAAKCNAIGAELGLGEVGVKGRAATRGGPKLPDCAQWPLNVRPAGYYGPSERAGKAQARAGGGAAPGERKPRQTKVDKALALFEAMTPEERGQFLELAGL